MAVAKRRSKKWNDEAQARQNMNPTELIAHDIVSERGDLAPSVEKIMSAPLDSDERLRAITLFQNSLGVLGDPHRDPRVAIANSSVGDGAEN